MENSGDHGGGLLALHKLKSTDPPLFLSPAPDLSQSTRLASEYLFTSLKPYTPKTPFDQLLTNGFDAEQIWQQIDLQSQPLILNLRHQIKRFEKDPVEISKNFLRAEESKELEKGSRQNGEVGLVDEDEDEELEGFSDDDDDDDMEKEEVDVELSGDEGDEDDEDEEGEEEDDDKGDCDGDLGVEDKFLKIKDLEKFVEDGEEMEYGMDENKSKKANHAKVSKKDSGDDFTDGEEEEDDSEEDNELAIFGDVGDADDSEDLDNARYADFFASGRQAAKRKFRDVSDDLTPEDEFELKKIRGLSTHEKELQKIKAEIEEMERTNLEPKAWTMQGEVTAAKRPKDSALEVDLDFEHNVRPPPVITEEVTATLEEIIKKRIVEGRFDDVQRAAKLPSKPPREVKELDDNKSKKGLAEIYEEKYTQQTGLAPASTSASEESKKEASLLFKKICLKLDALSHFHFAPKPVIEDMSVQTNVPALAMEEIAPVAASDAAMLAPEEVFGGKGDIKEEEELTKAERKRRRAKKKRKFKAVQDKRMMEKKARESTSLKNNEGKELF